MQHLLTEMGSRHIKDHSFTESKTAGTLQLISVSTISAYIFTSSANNFELTPDFFKCSSKSLIKIRNHSGPITLPWTVPLVSSATSDNDNPSSNSSLVCTITQKMSNPTYRATTDATCSQFIYEFAVDKTIKGFLSAVNTQKLFPYLQFFPRIPEGVSRHFFPCRSH